MKGEGQSRIFQKKEIILLIDVVNALKIITARLVLANGWRPEEYLLMRFIRYSLLLLINLLTRALSKRSL